MEHLYFMSKNHDGAKPEGAEPEAKTLWFFQTTEPVSADHKQFLEALTDAKAININSQQLQA